MLRNSRGQVSVGISFQFSRFSSLQGADLREGTFPTNAARVAGSQQPFSVDTLDLELQPQEGALSNWIYENCEVVERSDLGDGVTHLRIRVPQEKRHRLARLAGAGRIHIDAAE